MGIYSRGFLNMWAWWWRWAEMKLMAMLVFQTDIVTICHIPLTSTVNTTYSRWEAYRNVQKKLASFILHCHVLQKVLPPLNLQILMFCGWPNFHQTNQGHGWGQLLMFWQYTNVAQCLLSLFILPRILLSGSLWFTIIWGPVGQHLLLCGHC